MKDWMYPLTLCLSQRYWCWLAKKSWSIFEEKWSSKVIVEGQPRMPLFFANASRRSWKRHFDRVWFFLSPTHLTHCLPYNATPGVQERALPWYPPPHVFWDPPPRWSNPCWSAVSQLLEADLLHHYDHPDHYGRTWLKWTPSPAILWEPKRLTLHLPTFRDETSPWLLSKPGHCHGAYYPDAIRRNWKGRRDRLLQIYWGSRLGDKDAVQ